MKALEQLILSKSRPVQKEAKQIGVSELDKLIMEALLGEKREFGQYSKEQQEAIVAALNKLKVAFPNIEFKSSDSANSATTAVFHNTSKTGVERDAAIKRLFPDAKDYYPYKRNPKFAIGVRKYKGLITFILKAGGVKSGAFNPTNFEGNLIDAINGNDKSKKEKKNLGGYIDSEGKEITWTDIAQENIDNIKNLPEGTAKFSPSSALTKVYKARGVRSGTSKADIQIGETRVSVKKYEASQILSAQGPEFAAILDVVGRGAANDEALDIVQSLMRPKRFEDEIEDVEVKPVETGPKGEVLPESEKRKIKGTWSLSPEDNLEDELANAIFVQRTQESLDKLKEKIRGKVIDAVATNFDKALDDIFTNVISKPDFMVKVLREAATGEYKFENKLAIADSILKWSVDNPASANFNVINDTYLKSLLSESKLDIRLREKHRGLAARIDRKATKPSQNEGKFLVTEAEDRLLSESSQLILEGLFGDVLQAAKEMGTKVWSKAKQVWQELKNYVTELLTQIFNYLKEIAEKGFGYLLQFLGMKITNSTGIVVGEKVAEGE